MDNIFINFKDREYITFYADKKKLTSNYEEYERFIKGCESIVRNDRRYVDYIAKLKSNGLNRCAILGNLPENSKIAIEMHHGPIFNLFDLCDIILNYLWNTGEEEITTFTVGDIILSEHEEDNIQIVMLNKSTHKSIHNRANKKPIFIDPSSTFGRLDRFIDKYEEGMLTEHYDKMNKYIRRCKKNNKSTDNGLFDIMKLASFR